VRDYYGSSKFDFFVFALNPHPNPLQREKEIKELLMRIKVPSLTLKLVTIVLFCSITVLGQRGLTLRGHVTDQFAAAIVGATVTIIDQNRKQQTTQTDDQGAYRFNGLAPGTYTLRATRTGFAPYDEAGLKLSSTVTRQAAGRPPPVPQRLHLEKFKQPHGRKTSLTN
jgi:hypothetical protein